MAWVTGLLFVVGLVALYVEVSTPGLGLGGLVSLLCFALFFWSRFLGGTAEVLEIVLFLTGVAFLAVEIFVLPGFGVAGITGLLLMLAGVLMASQTFLIPETKREWEVFGTPCWCSVVRPSCLSPPPLFSAGTSAPCPFSTA